MAEDKSILCPNCSKYTYLTVRGSSYEQFQKNGGDRRYYWMGECNNCHFIVLVNSALNASSKIEKTYPKQLAKAVDDKTPEFLKKDLEEAYDCFAISAWRATGVMARRALQLCCIDKGAPSKPLRDQIDWLLSQNKINSDLHDWAHQVRLVGNDAAHPPKDIQSDNKVTETDAQDMLALLEQFVQSLYIAPKIAEQMKLKRNPTPATPTPAT